MTSLSDFHLPPNLANPTIVGPLSTQQDVNQGLSDAGINPDDYPAWDWRDSVKLLPPSNQQLCGDCWAHSSTNALTDKFLVKQKLIGLELNQLITTVCVPDQNTMCNGGSVYTAGKFFEKYGVAQGQDCPPSWNDFCNEPANQNCKFHIPPDNEFPNSNLPNCSAFNNCNNTPHNYRALPSSTKSLSVMSDPATTIRNIKAAILQDGPVVATFAVLADFALGTGKFTKDKNGNTYNWDATSGIYVNGSYEKDLTYLYGGVSDPNAIKTVTKVAGNPPDWTNHLDGWHAVEVVGWNMNGWDPTNMTPTPPPDGKSYPYWIVKNSWGDGWNEGGYWRHGMYPFNQQVYLDIPQDDQGTGGCTNFQIDPNSGGAYGTKVGDAKSGGSVSIFSVFSNKMWKTILIIVGGILVLFLLFHLVKFMFGGVSWGGKRKGSY